MTIVHTMILLGGGGHAAVVAETVRASGMVVLGYLDDAELPADAPESPIFGFKRMGALADLSRVMTEHRHAYFHAAVGDNALRSVWLDLPAPRGTPAVIHPTAIVSPTAKIEDGAFIGAGAVINARALVKRGVIVNTAAIIEHDCVLEEFCHCGPGSVLSGNVKVGRVAMIGAGAVVIPGVTIGEGATLGAGGVAISDISANATAIGVPAKTV